MRFEFEEQVLHYSNPQKSRQQRKRIEAAQRKDDDAGGPAAGKGENTAVRRLHLLNCRRYF